MVKRSIIKAVRHYLSGLPAVGINARKAILFGSFARGEQHEWSDIDLIVVAPEFDKRYNLRFAQRLWGARAGSDVRIEPIPCGVREWEEDDSRPILEIARKEGIVISL